MKIVFVLIILAVVLLSVAIVVFFWAVRKRQFDDLDVHAYNILKEDVYEIAQDEDQNQSQISKTNPNSSNKQT